MAWEFDVLNWIQENLRCSLFDAVFPIITFLGNGGWFWIVLTLVGFIHKKTRRYAFISAFALICCLVFGNLILKPCIARIRPFDVQTGIQLLVEKPNDYSFPSGHTQASFATATAVFFRDKRWGIVALALATLIAFSRMYLYVHYPTDILAGVAFGVGYAIIGKLLIDYICKKRGVAA